MNKKQPLYSDYSVLPRLEKIDSKLFPINGMFKSNSHFIKEKRKAFSNGLQKPVNIDSRLPNNVYNGVREKICEWTTEYPNKSLSKIINKIPEDIGIHVLPENDEDYLGYTHICFSSGWKPEEKIGKNFAEIHHPVPGMKLDHYRKMVEAMVYSGPFQRWVWSVVYDPWSEQKINYHPSLPKKQFDINNPYLHIKTESQIIYGIPELRCCIFMMRQNLIPFSDVDLEILYQSCYNMTEQEREYKGVTDNLLLWMESQHV